MSSGQEQNIKSSIENSVSEEHTVNMYFRNTLANHETQEQILKTNPNNHKFIDMVQKQNSMILECSASNYDDMQEKFEALGRTIIKFEEKIKNLDKHELNNAKLSEFQEKFEKNEKEDKPENVKTKAEIEQEVIELQNKIDEDNKKIVDLKSAMETLIKKITSDEDLINKISQERKSILDSIEESFIVDLTYREEFIHNYQFDLLEIILENLNKMSFAKLVTEKMNKEFTAEYDPQLLKTNLDSERKRIIMNEFKNTCFNAWKFKNQLLCLEGLNLISESEIRQMRERVEKIMDPKEIKLSEDDPSLELFFEPMYKLLKIFLFLSVGMKRISILKAKFKSLESESKDCKLRSAENNGKIQLLYSIRARLKDDKFNEVSIVSSRPQKCAENLDIDQDIKNFLKEIKNVKNTVQKEYTSLMKNVGQNLVKPQQLKN